MNKVPLALLALFAICAAPLLAQDALETLASEAANASKPADAPVPTVDTSTAPPAATEMQERRTEPNATPRKRAKAPDAARSDSASSATPRPTRRVPFAERTPTPTPQVATERRPTFWERLFGGRRTQAQTITPVPSPTPATPKPKTKRRSTPAPRNVSTTNADDQPSTPTPVIAATNTSGPRSVETPQVDTPAIDPVPEPVTTPPGKTTKTTGRRNAKGKATPAPETTSKRPLPPPPTSSDPDVQEKYRYEVAKSKAQDDTEVSRLKEKADSASTEDEARKAQRAYNKALFQKMRGIDGSLKERIDRIESGILRRLEE